MTDIVPIPAAILSSEFPTNADRTAGTFNPKSVAWAQSARDMSERDREIAVAGRTNALAAKESAEAAVPAAAQVAADRVWMVGAVLPACNDAVAARNEAVPAAAQALDAAQRAENAAASIEDGPVTAVNGKTGVVNLGIVDVVAPGDIVAYGATKELARKAVDAGYDYARGRQTFSTSQNINKSLFGTAKYVFVELWGGGGSGAGVKSGTGVAAGGGEGGSYVSALLEVSDLAPITLLTVGAGGASVSIVSNQNIGNAGGDTSFGNLLAKGGRAGTINNTNAKSVFAGANGGGGGISSQVSNATDRLESAIFGGGGGGVGGSATGLAAYSGGNSAISGRGGTGGDGFNGIFNGESPAGGGGGVMSTVWGGVSGSGGSGRARFTWW